MLCKVCFCTFIICYSTQKSSGAQKVYKERSVLQRLHRGGESAAAVDEDGGVTLVDRHDGAVAQQAAEVQHFARLAADGRDDADGGGLAVDHAHRRRR